MRKTIDRRLAAAEEAARSKAPKLCITVIRGGLPGALRCARIDGLHLARLPEEDVEIFEKKILAAAENAKAKMVIFGGLCGCVWKTSEDFEAYLAGPDFQRFDEEQRGDR